MSPNIKKKTSNVETFTQTANPEVADFNTGLCLTTYNFRTSLFVGGR